MWPELGKKRKKRKQSSALSHICGTKWPFFIPEVLMKTQKQHCVWPDIKEQVMKQSESLFLASLGKYALQPFITTDEPHRPPTRPWRLRSVSIFMSSESTASIYHRFLRTNCFHRRLFCLEIIRLHILWISLIKKKDIKKFWGWNT